MSHSSLGYSFIESTDKIKEKMKKKPEKKITAGESAGRGTRLPEHTPKTPLLEEFTPMEDEEDDSGLANVDFAPPPKPESSGVERTKSKEVALAREEQHPAEPFAKMSDEFAREYYEQYLPFANPQLDNGAAGPPSNTSDLEKKLNYMIHLLEDQKDEKMGGITEEIVLYCFLGVFIIFVLDSFAKVGKYVR